MIFLKTKIGKILKQLDKKVEVREKALKKQRKIVPLCAQAIRDVQKNKVKKAEKSVKEIEKIIKEIEKDLEEYPDLKNSVLGTPYQEYAELMILITYLKNKRLPELNIPPQYYLTGLGDAIGELKRTAMDYLGQGDLKKAEGLYKELEELNYLFSKQVYPNSIVPGLKQKQDAARRILNNLYEQIVNYKIKKQ